MAPDKVSLVHPFLLEMIVPDDDSHAAERKRLAVILPGTSAAIHTSAGRKGLDNSRYNDYP